MTEQNISLEGDFDINGDILEGPTPEAAAGIVVDGTSVDDVLGGGIDDDVLNGLDGNDELYGYAGADTLNGGAGNDMLFGGSDFDILNGGDNDDQLYGGSGKDVLNGGKGADYLDGGLGGDKLKGGGSSDVYFYQGDQGIDRIYETKGNSDTLLFAAGITLGDLVVSHSNTDGNAHKDLTIEIIGAGGSMTIEEVFRSNRTGSKRQIDFFEFDDGTIMTRKDFFTQTYHAGTVGNETLHGTRLADKFTSSLGDDKLKGGKGNDTYTVEFDQGDDTIIETDGKNDKIVFGAGITIADLVATNTDNDGNPYGDLTISFVSNTGSITITDFFRDDLAGAKRRIETFKFEDGTTLTLAEFLEQVYLAGSTGNDILDGTPGDDTFTSSLGDDIMMGGSGDDTYNIDIDQGEDKIYENSGEDRIVFSANILFADLILTADDYDLDGFADLMISFAGSTGSITISDIFRDDNVGNTHLIETFEFEFDGIMTIAELLTQAYHNGTAVSDVIYGTNRGDTFTDSLGDDFYISGNGHDSFFFDVDGGNDTIFEDGGENSDTITFAAGITLADLIGSATDADFDENFDLEISFAAATGSITLANVFRDNITGKNSQIDFFEFDDGTILTQKEFFTAVYQSGTSGADYLLGTYMGDIFFDSLGDDTYLGGDGHDTYNIDMNSGDDRIEERGGNANDRIIFGAGVTLGDLVASATDDNLDSYYDLTLTYGSGTGSITLEDVFRDDITGKTSQIDLFEFEDGTVLTQQEFFTAVYQSGTTGADDLLGTFRNDVFHDSLGDDTYYGGEGHDTYNVAANSGDDRINENGGNSADRVIFGAGITIENIVGYVTDDNFDGHNDLTLTYNFAAGSVTLEDFYRASTAGKVRQIEFFEFADGTEMTKAEFVAALYVATAATTGNDTIAGSIYNDFIYGDAGNDTITGSDGVDEIYGEAGNDILSGDDGADYIEGGIGTDTLNGGIGNDTLYGGDDADTLNGGADDDDLFGEGGNDTLNGDAGSDTLNGGSGDDTLNGGTEGDTLSGGIGSDTLNGGSGSDLLSGGDNDDFIFGDSGNDNLYGGSGNDLLDGGLGTDYLTGGAGTDTFYFAAVADSPNTNAADHIVDFVSIVDFIDISNITLGSGTFINTLAFGASGATEVRYSVDGFGNANVSVDVDGDGVGDMKIVVEGVAVLDAFDFII